MQRRRGFAVLAFLTLFLAGCGINSIPRAEDVAKANWADVQARFEKARTQTPGLIL